MKGGEEEFLSIACKVFVVWFVLQGALVKEGVVDIGLGYVVWEPSSLSHRALSLSNAPCCGMVGCLLSFFCFLVFLVYSICT